MITSIFASTISGGIGAKNRLPWSIRGDIRNFEHITSKIGKGPKKNNVVIMGRKTWESLDKRYKPLRNRTNCVVSSQPFQKDGGGYKLHESAIACRNLEDAITKSKRLAHTVYITGGAGLYDDTHRAEIADYIVWTRVCGMPKNATFDAKVDLTYIEKNYQYLAVSKTCKAKEFTYDVVLLKRRAAESRPPSNLDYERELMKYVREATEAADVKSLRTSSFPREYMKPANVQPRSENLQSIPLEYCGHEEMQYLNVMKDIIETGIPMDDRTGVGTLWKFGAMMRFDLRETFPLITTKRVYWKGVVEELLWFLQGKTDSNLLSAKDVKIWDDNGTKEFLTKRGLGHRRAGDLGPVYGFQWRHFGADYDTCDSDYKDQGFDQVKDLLDCIKSDPNSRRLIISAWNPSALRYMALPPCHVLSQFLIDEKKKEISCALYQRSGDWGLGIPFNIASYSLLTCIIGHLTGYKPREFVHFVANAHVYKNHVGPLKQQLLRLPRPFPQISIAKDAKDVDTMKASDIHLLGYEPYPAIKMAMAV